MRRALAAVTRDHASAHALSLSLFSLRYACVGVSQIEKANAESWGFGGEKARENTDMTPVRENNVLFLPIIFFPSIIFFFKYTICFIYFNERRMTFEYFQLFVLNLWNRIFVSSIKLDYIWLLYRRIQSLFQFFVSLSLSFFVEKKKNLSLTTPRDS